MSLKEILKLVLGWRLLIVIVALPAMFLLAPRTRFTNLTPTPSVANVFSMWSNFDGLHYLDLAEFGYGYQHKTDMDYAFFPVYPWAIKTFNVFGNYLASGLIISHLSLILALYFLYKLVAIDFKKKIAKETIILTLLFPTSLFFGSVYTESLFILLAVLSFYFARKNQFFLACTFAAIASATKITGIFLWPALIYEFWLAHGQDIRKSLNLSTIWLAIPPLGLISFMRFQYIKTGNALFFATLQSNFTGRSMDKLILLHQVYFRYAKMLIFTDHLDPLFFTVVLELLSASLILLVLIFSLKKIRLSYWLYSLLSFILPTLTGTFMSVPRFTLVLFPVFLYLALFFEKNHPYFRYAYYTLCLTMTLFSIFFFTRGYFIS
ncbi:MAG: hypothetical protein UW68_C0002G0044 [Candidatus Collierbacteria bacterium GW2011_GWB1_44_6]|uniref:Uncharacterized protein n=2 Tax=Candidatus Collieribacteriota TaxID=1752725 RepID=A0A0G1JQS4_9BACT|nr:MAG: hypothetical protein UV68_C0003G0008 [Candidatus Collierbacteria bacterium GW2011_GWC2_43_12]KKT73775.1 MAG: hypothetical protein UW68_C0002G0044 [Candidatus Collierbacteria bacterium GW2011_GWB1_44_6]KKT83753.1 MAG: hypothetical protein UW80_C0007G0008 [Microgenomates group bacterium GW2011_GWC1_44_9]